MSQRTDAPASPSAAEDTFRSVLATVEAHAVEKLTVAGMCDLARWGPAWEELNRRRGEHDATRAGCVQALQQLVRTVDATVRPRCLDDLRELLPLLDHIFGWRQPVEMPFGGLYPYNESPAGSRTYLVPHTHALHTATDHLRALAHTFHVRLRRFVEDWTVWMAPANADPGNEEFSGAIKKDPGGTKRSTERGEAQTKLVAALTAHHKYACGGALNMQPIGNNQLARLADVDKATASAFFQKEFGGHDRYKSHFCRDAGALVAAIKQLNGEYTPDVLFGRHLPREGDRDDG